MTIELASKLRLEGLLYIFWVASLTKKLLFFILYFKNIISEIGFVMTTDSKE